MRRYFDYKLTTIPDVRNAKASKLIAEIGDIQTLAFKKTNFTSHGQPVFKKGNTYITPDADGHSNGVWKATGSLGSKSTRWGTYDANLNRIGA